MKKTKKSDPEFTSRLLGALAMEITSLERKAGELSTDAKNLKKMVAVLMRENGLKMAKGF